MKKYIYLLILTFFSSSVAAEGWYAGAGYLKSDQDIHNYPSLTYSINDSEDDGYTIFAGYDNHDVCRTSQIVVCRSWMGCSGPCP